MSRKQGIAVAFKIVASLLMSLWAATSHATTELYYVHTDHLGTPQVMTDKDREVVWERSQTPFGETVEETGTIEQPLRFPGQYRDRETGFSYNYFRDYDPSLGRYLQYDPIGLEGGLNTYAYVDGNPLVYIDPVGLAGRPGLGSGVESHNGGKKHVHWGTKADPRANAVNEDGSVRHGKEPPRKVKDKINKKFGWNLRGLLMKSPLPPSILQEILSPGIPDPMEGVPPEC